MPIEMGKGQKLPLERPYLPQALYLYFGYPERVLHNPFSSRSQAKNWQMVTIGWIVSVNKALKAIRESLIE